MKLIKTAIQFVSVLLGLVYVAFIAWFCDSLHNHGFEFGYFGDFNRVGHALGHIPGVSITLSWANEDVTLEEFGYEITPENGKTVRLDFGESDALRDMTGQQLTDGLLARIRQQP